jgi:transcriptional regulator with XRE-family HTH domain
VSTTNFPSVIGTLFREARLKAGMTQEHLAARTRVTREYVSLLELGKRTPTIFVFIRIARALGKSPSSLLSQIEEQCPGEVALAEHIKAANGRGQKR